jgi:hypothetical protein
MSETGTTLATTLFGTTLFSMFPEEKSMRNVVLRQLRNVAGIMIVSGLVATGTAFADAVQAGVTIPSDQPVPVITENGYGYTSGTYAIGTVQLNYTTVATTFPTGTFAVFKLNMKDVSTKGQAPDYLAGVRLSLDQNGGDNLTLTPDSSLFDVTGLGWTGSVLVTVSIPDSVATDPALNKDGGELVGHLTLAAARADGDPGDSHLKTTTNILVKIKLVHSTACLKVYDFISDASLANTITSTEVNVNTKGKVTATNPYGSLSENVMVVNSCATSESFDLRVFLDAWYSTQPTNNPGNAVFTFATAGEIDAAAFNIASFGLGTAQGQNLCLKNVTVPAGSTFLATVHMSINNGVLATALPASKVFSGFAANLTTAGSSCGGSLISIATPNPASAPLSFSIK